MTTPPVLHLPLSFPSPSSHKLTTWNTITLNLPTLITHFSSYALAHTGDADTDEDGDDASISEVQQYVKHGWNDGISNQVPEGLYDHVSFVKVYATCRLRRIWFSESGPGQKLPWEFELYGVSN